MPGVRVPQPGCTPVVLPITPEAALPGLSYRPGVWACLQVALLALLKTALPLAPLLGEPHNPGGRLPITGISSTRYFLGCCRSPNAHIAMPTPPRQLCKGEYISQALWDLVPTCLFYLIY